MAAESEEIFLVICLSYFFFFFSLMNSMIFSQKQKFSDGLQ